MTSAKNTSPFQFRRALRWLAVCCLIAAPTVIGCISYPLQSLPNESVIVLADQAGQSASKGVDILFVVDNSQSMGEEQTKLRNNFRRFIEELLTKDVSDFQLGVITTDMDQLFNPDGWGRLVQGDANTPKIITSSLTTTQIIEAFTKNANVGELGSNFEKPLEAIRSALDPDPKYGGWINNDRGNKGFLREGALLAIIIISDEDDCSHDGLSENKTPDTCYIPPSVTLTDDKGNPLIGPDGQPERGQMDKLTKVSDFLEFLKRLNREVIVSGLIGPPFILRPGTDTPIDPTGGCKQDIECGGGGAQCAYLTPSDPPARQCGGCTSVDGTATPGFRLYEFISKSAAGDPNERWFSICGDNEGFSQALLRFAGAIIDRLRNIILSKKPENPDGLIVRVTQPNGSVEEIPKAPAVGACKADGTCDGDQECGADSQCYGNGWVYIPPIEGSGQHRLRLSGEAKRQPQPGAKITVTYLAKPTK